VWRLGQKLACNMISISSEGRTTGYYGDGYQLPNVQSALCGPITYYLLVWVHSNVPLASSPRHVS